MAKYNVSDLLTGKHLSRAAYKAADGVDGWSVVDDIDINAILSADAQAIRLHVRDLVRNFPYFARAVDILSIYIVGSGIVPQSQVPQNSPYNKAIEDYLSEWMKRADVSRSLHFYEMQELCIRQLCESGEYLFIEHFDRNGDYSIQAVESDWLVSDSYDKGSSGTVFQNGIGIDISTGKKLTYRFQTPYYWDKTDGYTFDVPADRVIHGFKTLRPGQLRGISPFVAGVTLAKQLAEYIGAEVNAAKLAARFLAMVETPDPLSRQAGMSNDYDGDKLDYIEEAIIEYLRPGEKITFAKADRPGDAFTPFIKFCCQIFAVITGVPYELISGTYEDLNYSTARVTRNDFTHFLRPHIDHLIRNFCQPVIVKALDAGVMSGKLDIPDYFTHRTEYTRFTWQYPGTDSVDPLKESKAHREDMAAYTRSPIEIAAARGRDFGEILQEFKKAQDMAKEYGLDIDFLQKRPGNNNG